MSTPNPIWGKRLRDTRLSAGLSQVRLAAALGVAQQQVSLWEQGIHAPRDDRRPVIARVLGVSVSFLFPYPEENGEEAA